MRMTAPRSPRRGDLPECVGLAGALMSVLMLSGCPGTLDPHEFQTGGNTGSGGITATGGTGGGNPTGGAIGTGGNPNCTGGNDGATIVTMNCASVSCHIPGAVNDGTTGGLDLTVDANIASRLVGVMSVGTADNMSKCMGNTTPYLNPGSKPATGLLIDKINPSPPCGVQMPASSPMFLTPMQKTCLIQWATTLTSP